MALSDNFIGPELPNLTKLSNLRILDLSSTFIATFPQVNGLGKLEVLDLSSTFITGDILPAEFTSTSLGAESS